MMQIKWNYLSRQCGEFCSTNSAGLLYETVEHALRIFKQCHGLIELLYNTFALQ